MFDDISHIQEQAIKEIARIFDGGGGGRPDFAQAGGIKAEFLDKAIERSYSIIEKMLGTDYEVKSQE